LGIPKYDAELITMQKRIADMFDKASAICGNPKMVSNWIMTDLMRRINEKGESVLDSALNGETFGKILLYVDKGEITQASGKKVLDTLIETGEEPDSIIERLGLKVQRDEGLVLTVVKEIMGQNPQALADFAAGKEKAFGFLMGKVMGLLKGKGDPAQVKEVLTRELNNSK
ncbi:MAG: Asp-tRNA(Asn)/Glu-tRNA(Gln) amidotransferase GatCAB subunit B, partial [Clostridia bacterium]|nr:Asp-tRNA(Asn)/Glu-tRNA(Gln) amidotransferase GatCAB subunit B [Clostridia bacterium]